MFMGISWSHWKFELLIWKEWDISSCSPSLLLISDLFNKRTSLQSLDSLPASSAADSHVMTNYDRDQKLQLGNLIVPQYWLFQADWPAGNLASLFSDSSILFLPSSIPCSIGKFASSLVLCEINNYSWLLYKSHNLSKQAQTNCERGEVNHLKLMWTSVWSLNWVGLVVWTSAKRFGPKSKQAFLSVRKWRPFGCRTRIHRISSTLLQRIITWRSYIRRHTGRTSAAAM